MFNEKVWRDGEKITAEYLKGKNYKIVYLNYNCKIAELDIVSVLSKKVQKKYQLFGWYKWVCLKEIDK